MNIIDQFKRSSSRGEYFVDDENAFSHLETPRVKLIAYYLPQFHPIPENDDWWGKGFTEWRNITKSMPRFEGHYQPHLPGSLGFYDLRIPDVLREQAKLAKKYGIEAFCFHRYWFNGKTLLETPLKIFLENPDIDIKFCLNWANENWSRRWNGGDREVLIAQKHSPEDDIAFAKSLEPFLRDRRYLRVGNRPLIMIYRPGILPDGAATVQRWREHFASAGSPDPYIVMAQTGDVDPRPYGIDAAAGFPPHNATAGLKDHSSAMRFFFPRALRSRLRLQ